MLPIAIQKANSVFNKLTCFRLWALLLFISYVGDAQPMAFQGFENPSDVSCWSGAGTITRVPSGGGTLHLPSFDGNFHAEITNLDDDYQAPGYGDSQYTFFCLPATGYLGDFSQSISVYIVANWTPAATGGVPSFWIDESPRDASGAVADGGGSPASNFSAEHNFQLTATGTNVQVTADGQAIPFATITTTGWYTFQITWRKDPIPTNPVISDLTVFNALGTVVGTTTTPALSVPLPLLSNNLGGPGYLWFTVWQNGFAGDILAIDDARVGGLSAATGAGDGPFQIGYAANLNIGDSILNLSNDGVNGGVTGGSAGNICVNVYVFDPQEEETGCCACLVTPDGLNSLSVTNDLISNNLTPAVPTSVTINLLASTPGADTVGNLTSCNAATAGTAPFALESGLLAWGTTLAPSSTPGTYKPVNVPYLNGSVSGGEVTGLTSLCNFIQANGTGYGICKSCRLGALGGKRQ